MLGNMMSFPIRHLLKEWSYNDESVKNALVIVTIEKILLDIGKAVYEKVVEKLNKEHHCYLSDCYEHPEYLSKVLKDLFGNASTTIIESITKELAEFETKKSISRFLLVINQ
jgi:hypothetical protein